MHLGSQQIAPACVQSNLLGLGIGSWCCVVEPMLTELVNTTTTILLPIYMVQNIPPNIDDSIINISALLGRPYPSRSFCASRLDALNEEPASFSPG